MTQDQDGQSTGAGYVVRGEVVPDDETDVSRAEQATPMTRFQKVASALRRDGSDQPAAVSSPDYGDAADHEDDTETAAPEDVGAAGSPDADTGAGAESDPTLGDLSDFAYGSLVGDAAELRAQWHQIQYMFVDDPRGSVAEAADVIAQASAKLEAAIGEWLRAVQERQRWMRGRWGEGANADTETLRETLRTYRGFLDQLTGSRGPTGPRPS